MLRYSEVNGRVGVPAHHEQQMVGEYTHPTRTAAG
jgi:hypothetical protein